MRRRSAAILLASTGLLLLGCPEPARHGVESASAANAPRTPAPARPTSQPPAGAERVRIVAAARDGGSGKLVDVAPDAGTGAASGADARTACVDAWLGARGLDRWGKPHGTMYLGGTPEFDETTGTRVDRWTVLARNRPDALTACPPGR